MSILINKNTRVITQGITGKTGQFHTRACREYANGRACFVAGVHPKKAGEDFEGTVEAADRLEDAGFFLPRRFLPRRFLARRRLRRVLRGHDR